MRLPPIVLFTLVACGACGRQPPPSSAPAASTTSSATPPSEGAGLKIGSPAPDFAATTYDGKPFTLSQYRGRPVVVYFYPKDETPGCTKEACSFRDSWDAITATHAVLVGVSRDGAEAHREFVEHWKLPFLLVSDPDGAIAAKYGVPPVQHGGATFDARQTFVVGADGAIRKIYRTVDVTKHAGEVLGDLTR